MKKLLIYDTTLRDGEQAPGFGMTSSQKQVLAEAISSAGIDIIEAGFPSSSKYEIQTVKEIAKNCRCEVSALSRAVTADIEAAAEALMPAEKPRLHIFISASDIQIKHQLNMTHEQVVKTAVRSIEYAKSFIDNVQFSAMDATRSDHDFLCYLLEQAIDAGACTVNIADTVGYILPSELYSLVKRIKYQVRNINSACLSVHCHNDLGLATANTIAAIEAGVDQIECTFCGIGERAGNAAIEKIINILNTRKDRFGGIKTNMKNRETISTCRMLAEVTGHPEITNHILTKSKNEKRANNPV